MFDGEVLWRKYSRGWREEGWGALPDRVSIRSPWDSDISAGELWRELFQGGPKKRVVCAKALRWGCVWLVAKIRRKSVWLELNEQRGVGRWVIMGRRVRGEAWTTENLLGLGKNRGFHSKQRAMEGSGQWGTWSDWPFKSVTLSACWGVYCEEVK